MIVIDGYVIDSGSLPLPWRKTGMAEVAYGVAGQDQSFYILCIYNHHDIEGKDDNDEEDLIVCHIGWMLGETLHRLAQVRNLVARHVQKDLTITTIIRRLENSNKCLTLLVLMLSLVSFMMGRLVGNEVISKWEQSIIDSCLCLGI